MADTKIVVNGPSIGLGTLLTVLFVGLKLTGNIDWAWIWVISPILLPFALMAALFVIILVVGVIGGIFGALK